jgi:predicted MFS family arabinose efflux permease
VLDKIVLTVLIEPIRKEFDLSDSQIGALMGFVYAISMGAAALPMGILADRINRRNLAATCLAAWSAMTALCAIAQNGFQLLLGRIGVGIGEAGGGPAAISMIADTFERRRRATAMAIFATGTQIAALINLTLVTHIEHTLGWRAALIAVAAPGLLVALLLRVTIREPSRGAADKSAQSGARSSIRETLDVVWRQHSLRHLLLGATLSYIVVAGMGSWHFSFLVRSHGLVLHEIGPWLGVGIAVCGFASNLTAGVLSDHLGARDERFRAWLIAASSLATSVIGAWSVLTLNSTEALIGVIIFAATVWFPTVAALVQSLVEPRMRSTIAGVLFLLSNLIGYGLGPIAVGALGDALSPTFGPNALRYAMFATLSLAVWAAMHFFQAGRKLREELRQ